MRRALSCLPVALLFLASAVPSNGQMRRAEAGGPVTVSVAEGGPLAVECPLQPQQRAEWRLEGRAPPADMRAVERSAPGGAALLARLETAAARAHHAGLYECAPSSPRIRVRVLGATSTEAAPAPAEAGAVAAEASTPVDGDTLYFEVRGNFVLNCSELGSAGKITWKKNGTLLSELKELAGHVVTLPLDGVDNAKLTLSGRATESDFGNYTCSAGEQERSWVVLARPHAKIHPDTNVVEQQPLKIVCKMIGRPYPAVRWTYSNTSDTVTNGSDVAAALGADRVSLKTSDQGVVDGELVVKSAARSDAGWYRCEPLADPKANAVPAVTRVRVKDMYAALWPFLGICAEVFILCAIILVYEKRRTKPELDDSDTDNHDQKKS